MFRIVEQHFNDYQKSIKVRLSWKSIKDSQVNARKSASFIEKILVMK